MNSYKLPEGNVQISFSGGRTSGYMLYKILEVNDGLPDRAKVIFTNTGREMDQTLDFIQECSDRWNVKIVWLEYDINESKIGFKEVNHNSASRNGEPFEKLIASKQVLPNVLMRYCTVELKIRTAKRYLRKNKWKNWFNLVGLRYDEQSRLNKKEKKDLFVNRYPIAEAKDTIDDVDQFWSKQNFKLNLPVVRGRTMYGNCDGCFLKSEDQLAMLAKEFPQRFDWWLQQEKNHTHRGDYGYFNHDRKLLGLKNVVDTQQDWVFDQQGYFCQADGGDCTG